MNPVRRAFLQMIDRPRVAEDLIVKEGSPGTFSFASEAGERVPGIFIRPRGTGKAPIAIALHGTGGNKESMAALLRQLADRGWFAIAIDGRHHGARAAGKPSSAAYQDAILNTWRTGKGKPFLYDSVWDVHRLLDVLPTFNDADSSRIALMGISKGGMEAYLAAATDERITVTVPFIGVQSFRWGIENNGWQARVSTFQHAFDTAAHEAGVAKPDAAFLRRFYDRVAPGIYSDFDGPAMVSLIAPRALHMVNGEIDPRTPMPGLQQCIEAAKAAYKESPGRFSFVIQPNTAHQVRPEFMNGAVEWMAHFL